MKKGSGRSLSLELGSWNREEAAQAGTVAQMLLPGQLRASASTCLELSVHYL